jgi:hypothetical protein
METLLRVHDSPVPTQTFFEFSDRERIAPIDYANCSSNITKSRPLSSDFKPAAGRADKSVILPEDSRTPRWLRCAHHCCGTYVGAPRPEIVPD